MGTKTRDIGLETKPLIIIGNNTWTIIKIIVIKSAFFSWPSEWWHMVQKMTTLIFRSKITHDELINVV